MEDSIYSQILKLIRSLPGDTTAKELSARLRGITTPQISRVLHWLRHEGLIVPVGHTKGRHKCLVYRLTERIAEDDPEPMIFASNPKGSCSSAGLEVCAALGMVVIPHRPPRSAVRGMRCMCPPEPKVVPTKVRAH